MPSRDYGFFFCGLLLLSTSCYAGGGSLHLPKDRDSEHRGFLKKATHAVLKHLPVQDLLKLFPRKPEKTRLAKTRLAISAPMDPRPQSNPRLVEEPDYAEIDESTLAPTQPLLPQTSPPPPPFWARGFHSAPVSRVTSMIGFGSTHSLNILPSEKRLSEQEKFSIVQLLTNPNLTLGALATFLQTSLPYKNQDALSVPLRPIDRTALAAYVNDPNDIDMNALQDVTSLLTREYEKGQITRVNPDEPIYENWPAFKRQPYSGGKLSKARSVENPTYGMSLPLVTVRKREDVSLRDRLESASNPFPASRLKFYPRITQRPALSPVVETKEPPQLFYADLDWSHVAPKAPEERIPQDIAPPLPTLPPPLEDSDLTKLTPSMQKHDAFLYDTNGFLIPNSNRRDPNNNIISKQTCLEPGGRIENGCFIDDVKLPMPPTQKKKRRSVLSLNSLRQSWSRSSSSASSDTSREETDGITVSSPKTEASKKHKGFKRPSLKGMIRFFGKVASAPNLDKPALEAWTMLH